MGTILDAVRDEIATVERELEQLEQRLGPLREIEALAEQLNGAEPAEETPPPTRGRGTREPQSNADSAKKSGHAEPDAPQVRRIRGGGATPRKFTDEDLEAAANKILPLGHCTPNKVLKQLSAKSTPLRRRIEELLARWEREGRIVPDSAVRGHASFKLQDEPSPEPEAPAPELDDAGATSDSNASDEEPIEEVEEWVSDDELDDYAPSSKRPGEAIGADYQQLADRIKEAVTLDPKPTRAIAEMFGEDVKQIRRLTEKMVRMGILRQRGYTKDGKPMYQVTPSLEERGVTVKTADRDTPLEQRILAAIDEHGPLSIPGLAAKVVEPPREVAAAVNALIEKREVKKTRAHPDAVYERPEAKAAWAAA